MSSRAGFWPQGVRTQAGNGATSFSFLRMLWGTAEGGLGADCRLPDGGRRTFRQNSPNPLQTGRNRSSDRFCPPIWGDMT